METSGRPVIWSVLKKSGTKYRDIADGNTTIPLSLLPNTSKSGTKYRDIADGNLLHAVVKLHLGDLVRYQVPRYSGWKQCRKACIFQHDKPVRYPGPRYSGWKPQFASPSLFWRLMSEPKYRDIADWNSSESNQSVSSSERVRTQVPRYSGLKLFRNGFHIVLDLRSEPKYRDIADEEHPYFLFLASLCFI